ncbi:hypothetical protein M8J76_005087 [Diaphorina citri]|nr:hypothetical protein M8J76_005087 [Diaphorina citri]
MDLSMSHLMSVLSVLLVHALSGNEVSGCLDMLLKEFSQLFAGPGGSLMGTSNANNLDRIRMFNNYQPPSIDQIEDEQDMEGKLEQYDEYPDFEEFEDSVEIEVGRNKQAARRSKQAKEAKEDKPVTRNARREKLLNRKRIAAKDESKPAPNKRDSKSSSSKTSLGQSAKKKNSANDPSKAAYKSNVGLKEIIEKEMRQKLSGKPELPQTSLYQLEPKDSAYTRKAYKPNFYADGDADSMSFQPRDDIRNQPRTKNMNQPFIDMMVNVLDTIQLTSKHDYKRAKEKELRDSARHQLNQLHRN